MNAPDLQVKEKARKERAKKAVALAMKSRWQEAIALNRAILQDFPDDLEAYNRLGKALSETGHVKEAIEAFEHAIRISPHNTIAKKNLDRLSRLGDSDAQPTPKSRAAPQVFIEESGKSGVTLLVNLAPSNVLYRLAPGYAVELRVEGNKLFASVDSGEIVGQVEPRLAARLIRLMKGGNRYEATVTSSSAKELAIIIRETYKHPSQSGVVSFPSRRGSEYRVYVPSPVLEYDFNESESDENKRGLIKDWSDDDTEPGDDEAFTPVFHRIINSDGDDMNDDF